MTKKAHITTQQRNMAEELRRLGSAFVSPEWADADGFEEEVERQADLILSDLSEYAELLERSAQRPDFCLAVRNLHDTIHRKQPDSDVVDKARSLCLILAEESCNQARENM